MNKIIRQNISEYGPNWNEWKYCKKLYNVGTIAEFLIEILDDLKNIGGVIFYWDEDVNRWIDIAKIKLNGKTYLSNNIRKILPYIDAMKIASLNYLLDYPGRVDYELLLHPLMNLGKSIAERKHHCEDIFLEMKRLVMRQMDDKDHYDIEENFIVVNNGILDLKTGELRKQNKKDKFLKFCSVDYIPLREISEESLNVFLHFLRSVFVKSDGTPDDEFIYYFQELVGRSLCGRKFDDASSIFFLLGSSYNDGRDFLSYLINKTFGDNYSTLLPVEFFKRNHHGKEHNTELIQGKRLAIGKYEIGRDPVSLEKLSLGKTKLLLCADKLSEMTKRIGSFTCWTRFVLKPKEPLEKPGYDDVSLMCEGVKIAAFSWFVEGAKRNLDKCELIQPKCADEKQVDKSLLYTFLTTDRRIKTKLTDEKVDGEISNVELIEMFNSWGGNDCFNLAVFGKEMSKLGFQSVRKKTEGTLVRYYSGISITDETEIIHESLHPSSCDRMVSYIYLIQEREHFNLGNQYFKVGRTTQEVGLRISRFDHYKKESKLIFIINCERCDVVRIERNIINKFNEVFRLVEGKETFQGDEKEMIKIICNLAI